MKALSTAITLALGLVLSLSPNRAETLVGATDDDAAKNVADTPANKAAQLDWLVGGINDPHGAVWLNVGWYTRGDAPGEWKRTGGHWVTLVGCGDDAQSLLIHNPARSNRNERPDNPAHDVIHLEETASGTLHTGRQTTEDAAGMYRISGPGLPLAPGVDAAFLDDAIVLVVAH